MNVSILGSVTINYNRLRLIINPRRVVEHVCIPLTSCDHVRT
jgi:hypothetical protein